MSKHYDYIAIGGGSGGRAGARRLRRGEQGAQAAVGGGEQAVGQVWRHAPMVR